VYSALIAVNFVAKFSSRCLLVQVIASGQHIRAGTVEVSDDETINKHFKLITRQEPATVALGAAIQQEIRTMATCYSYSSARSKDFVRILGGKGDHVTELPCCPKARADENVDAAEKGRRSWSKLIIVPSVKRALCSDESGRETSLVGALPNLWR